MTKHSYSESEWEDRLKLAALYRLMTIHRMTDAANQALMLRCSDNPNHFLTHRLGSFFGDVKASELLRCDFEGVDVHSGEQLIQGKLSGLNAGILNLCVPIFESRAEINCMIHAHSKAVLTISMLQCGVLPVTQAALYIIPRLNYWPYIFNEDENFRSKFAKAFEGNQVIIAHNHGFYSIGKDPAEAFFLAFYLSQACDSQAAAMSCGEPLLVIPDEEAKATWEDMRTSTEYHYDGSMEWDGWMRMVERHESDYKL